MNGIDAIKEYRNNKDKYLPLVDHEKHEFQSKVYYEDNLGYDVNLGWNCGFFENRPYFYECWATDGITVITVFISTIGLEDATLSELEKFLIEDAKIYKPKEGYYSLTEAPKFADSNGNEFYSLNIVVGLEDRPAVIDGAPIYSFSVLNEFNGYTNQDTTEKNEYEIERKFLIRYPDIDLLEQVCTRQLSIAQTYLVTEQNISRRIRMQESGNKTEYWYNEKRKITDITRIEDEKEISKIEYENLYKEKLPNSNTIYKTRYCIPSGKHIFEIDVFRDWTEWAYAEVELASEEESYQLPECVSVIKEVTHDKRYTNRSLAINGFDI